MSEKNLAEKEQACYSCGALNDLACPDGWGFCICQACDAKQEAEYHAAMAEENEPEPDYTYVSDWRWWLYD